jgi:acyl-CoA thioesterase-1
MSNLARGLAATAFFVAAAVSAAQSEARQVNIVAFGDSNTAGFLTATEDSYPYGLETALKARGHDVRVTNSGVSGETSGGGLSRIDQAVPHGTDIAIVFFGRNDMRFGVGEARLRENLATIVGKLRGRGIQVVLCGYYGFDFSDIARKQGATYYPDFFSGTAVKGVKKPEYTRALDPLRHLNGAGYAIVVKAMVPVVEPLVRRAKATRTAPQ